MVKMPTKRAYSINCTPDLSIVFYCIYKNFCHDDDRYQWQQEKRTKVAVSFIQIVLLEYQYTHICGYGIQQ